MIQESTRPVLVFFFSLFLLSVEAQPDLSIYNVDWESPSTDATGPMPLAMETFPTMDIFSKHAGDDCVGPQSRKKDAVVYQPQP